MSRDGGERFCSDTCEAAWVKAGGQYGEGYRAALEAVKAEIEAISFRTTFAGKQIVGWDREIGPEDILARIARLEKEHGG